MYSPNTVKHNPWDWIELWQFDWGWLWNSIEPIRLSSIVWKSKLHNSTVILFYFTHSLDLYTCMQTSLILYEFESPSNMLSRNECYGLRPLLTALHRVWCWCLMPNSINQHWTFNWLHVCWVTCNFLFELLLPDTSKHRQEVIQSRIHNRPQATKQTFSS